MGQKMQTETGIAEIQQMRTAVTERDHAGRVFQQGTDRRIVVLKQTSQKTGFQSVLQRKIEKDIDRILPFVAGNVGNVAALTRGQRRVGTQTDFNA